MGVLLRIEFSRFQAFRVGDPWLTASQDGCEGQAAQKPLGLFHPAAFPYSRHDFHESHSFLDFEDLYTLHGNFEACLWRICINIQGCSMS